MAAIRPPDPTTLPLPLDDSAEDVILGLLFALIGDGGATDRGLMNLLVHGAQHVPNCPHGQWISPDGPRPHGDPCSERCLRNQASIARATRWLYARRPAALQEVV